MPTSSQWIDAGPLQLKKLAGSFLPLNTAKSTGMILHRACREIWRRSTGVHPTTAQTANWVHLEKGHLIQRSPAGDEWMAPGQTLAVPPGGDYHLQVPPDREATMVWISASGPLIEQWWQRERKVHWHILTSTRPHEVHDILDYLLEHAAADALPDRQLAAHYLQIFFRLLRLEARPQQPPPAAGRCHELLTSCPLRFPDYQSLAQTVGRHPDALTRSYYHHYREKPADALRRRKMNLACHWLAEESLALSSIAERLGYADAFAFSKAFKQYAGLSPRHWRQSLHMGGQVDSVQLPIGK